MVRCWESCLWHYQPNRVQKESQLDITLLRAKWGIQYRFPWCTKEEVTKSQRHVFFPTLYHNRLPKLHLASHGSILGHLVTSFCCTFLCTISKITHLPSDTSWRFSGLFYKSYLKLTAGIRQPWQAISDDSQILVLTLPIYQHLHRGSSNVELTPRQAQPKQVNSWDLLKYYLCQMDMQKNAMSENIVNTQ